MRLCISVAALIMTACGQQSVEVPVDNEVIPGPAGKDGKDGKDGINGKDGVPCFIVENNNGATITCGETSIFIRDGIDGLNGINGINGINGVDGKDGIDGVDGKDGIDANAIEVIDPCGDAPNIYDEVILKFPNGTLLSSFSDDASGKNTRFSKLVDGSYVTTDGSSCYFKVNKGIVSY